MTLIEGLDSAYAPTLQQAQQAYSLGYRWWGFYMAGIGGTDPLNTWTPAEVDTVRQAGITPLPIVVPAPPGVADAVKTATEAYNASRVYNLSPSVSICYNGEHITVSGPVWLPIPGAKPTSVGAQSAIQYTGGALGSIIVDYNVAAPDFPLTGIVCDLEHNAGYTNTWYALFQATIKTLAAPPTPKKGKPMFGLLVTIDDTTSTHNGDSFVLANGVLLPVYDALTNNFPNGSDKVSLNQLNDWLKVYNIAPLT